METDLDYEEITHYNCCAGVTLNPLQAEEMVAGFARAEGDWYDFELGTFGDE